MEITAIDQEINDYDWFAIDIENRIAHLSSAGGILPSSVTQSAEENILLVDYFQSLDIKENNFSINNSFQVPSNMQRPEIRKMFFRYYALYSAMGLYSFARNEFNSDGKWSDFEYSLLTIPAAPLSLQSLPIDIQEIVSRTRYNGVFSDSNILDLRNIT
jgi:hypothetical protein